MIKLRKKSFSGINKKVYLILVMTAFACVPAFAAANYDFSQTSPAPLYQPNNYPQNQYQINGDNTTLHGSVVTVPAGQEMRTVVTTPLSSETLTLGQSVSLALGSDFYYNGNLIAPAGSSVTGTVLEVSKAKHGSLNGKLLLRFTQITTPYGVQIPISAVIKTEDNSGVLIGGTKMDVAKEYTKDIIVGTGAGALSGVVFGALAGGSVGRGAALGTAVGAGGGLVKSIWDKGSDVVIPVNSAVDIMLTQPITVNPAINQISY